MKQRMNYIKKTRKITCMLSVNSQWVNGKIKEEIKKYLEANANANGNTTFQNLWDIAKSVLRGKFIVIQTFLKKQEKFQINKITPYLI